MSYLEPYHFQSKVIKILWSFFIAKSKFCYNVGAFNVFDTMEGGIIKIRACLRHLMALVVHETIVLITPTLENAVQAWWRYGYSHAHRPGLPCPWAATQDHYDSGSNRTMLLVKNGTFLGGKNVGLFHLHHNWLRSLHWAFFFNLRTWYVKRKINRQWRLSSINYDEDVCLHAQSLPSCLTLCYGLPGSYVQGILQARLWSGLPSSTPRDLPNPGIEPELWSLMSPAFSGRFFTTSTTWEAPMTTMRKSHFYSQHLSIAP